MQQSQTTYTHLMQKTTGWMFVPTRLMQKPCWHGSMGHEAKWIRQPNQVTLIHSLVKLALTLDFAYPVLILYTGYWARDVHETTDYTSTGAGTDRIYHNRKSKIDYVLHPALPPRPPSTPPPIKHLPFNINQPPLLSIDLVDSRILPPTPNSRARWVTPHSTNLLCPTFPHIPIP